MTIKRKQLILAWFNLIAPKDVDGIWGPQSKAATKKLQQLLDIPDTGEFDQNTWGEAMNAMVSGVELGEVIDANTGDEDWWEEIEYFSPKEFACKCGKYHKPYCDGYPHEIQPLLVQIADRGRKHFGKPMEIVSGLRCSQHNKDSKGVATSQHMYGEAADVYVYGVSQQTVLDWFLSQPDVRYAYAIEGSSNVHFDIQPVGR